MAGEDLFGYGQDAGGGATGQATDFDVASTNPAGFQYGHWGGDAGAFGYEPDGQGGYKQVVTRESGMQQDVNRYRQMASERANRPAYQANYGGFDRSGAGFEYGQGQARHAMDLQQQAAEGRAPSAAEIAGRQAIGQSIDAQMAVGASARGGSLAQASAMRDASTGATAFRQNALGTLAANRANEMANARNAYAGSSFQYGQNQMGQQGLQLGKTAQQIQNEQFQRGLNQSSENFYEGMGFNTKQAGLGADLGRSGQSLQATQASQQYDLGRDQLEQQKIGNIIQASQVPAGYTKSDVRSKNLLMTTRDGGITRKNPYGEGHTTSLSPRDEAAFLAWKAKNAPNDSGEDYDYRGAFKAGERPGRDGHWTDRFKKPNHPTFSDQSQYAKDAPERAGRWDGERFIPPRDVIDIDDYEANRRKDSSDIFRGDPYDDKTNAMLDDRLAQQPSNGKPAAFLDSYIADQRPVPEATSAVGGTMRERYAYSDTNAKKKAIFAAGMQAGVAGALKGGTNAAAPAPKPVISHAPSADTESPPVNLYGDAPTPVPERSPMVRQDTPETREANDPNRNMGLLDRVVGFVAGPGGEGVIREGRNHDAERAARDTAYSDARTKEDAARKLKSQPYTYKDEFLPPEQEAGEMNFGPMAQEMEKNPLTATAVEKDAEGMRLVDMHKLVKTQSGLIAHLQEQIDHLKGGKRYG